MIPWATFIYDFYTAVRVLVKGTHHNLIQESPVLTKSKHKMSDDRFQLVRKMWDLAACHFTVTGDLKYINDNSRSLRNEQLLQLEMCLPYLELKSPINFESSLIYFLYP